MSTPKTSSSVIPILFLGQPPFHSRWVVRLLLVLTIVLAVMAGHYAYALQLEQKKYLRLEDKYVRVRSELGVPETQRLIDQSYESE